MYLTAKRFIWSAERQKLKITGIKLLPYGEVSEIVFNVAYWRKANAIHKWFVDNVQDGNDDGQQSYIEIDQLKTLLETVMNVLDNHSLATTLLPTQTGFFFGGTEYDEYYIMSLEETKEQLKTIIDNHENNYEYYYGASW